MDTEKQGSACCTEPYISCLKAFIEGEKPPSKWPDEDTDRMLSKVLGPPTFNWMSFFLGSLYWAYRRCYVEAALLALCVWGLTFAMHFLGVRIGLGIVPFVAAFLFYPLYRHRAMRAYRKACANCEGDAQCVLSSMRKAGGTSLPAFFVMLACEAIAFGVLLWIAIAPLAQGEAHNALLSA